MWVTGPSRSGTSMVAGLFAQHGVFFGTCTQPNEYNPKGFFENVWFKRVIQEGAPPKGWPRPWFRELVDQGWCGCNPWGVKCGPQQRHLVEPMRPTVVVFCQRPLDQIARSRSRVAWATGPPRVTAMRAYRLMQAMHRELDVPVVHVRTDRLVLGQVGQIRPAFRQLGMELDKAVATDWIDPELWGRP